MPSQKLAKVFKSNDLNQSNFADFGLSAYRVFLNLITKIQRYDKNDELVANNVANREYSLSATEYAKEFSIPRNTAYSILKEVIDKLLKTSLSLPVELGLLKINVCSQALYIKDKGQINVRFTEEIMPHLAEIKNRFTMYNLCEVSGFNSIYTTRFYELLMQYKTTGILSISVSKLRDVLGCTHNYKLYNDFKRHGFGHAVKEINSQYEIGITFEEIKKGKAVDKLEFSFKKTIKNQVYDPVKKKIRAQLTRPKRKDLKNDGDIKNSPSKISKTKGADNLQLLSNESTSLDNSLELRTNKKHDALVSASIKNEKETNDVVNEEPIKAFRALAEKMRINKLNAK